MTTIANTPAGRAQVHFPAKIWVVLLALAAKPNLSAASFLESLVLAEQKRLAQ